MQKNLPFYLILISLLFSNLTLSAADFTIKGKVSIIQETVPLPFYEVSIADGKGNYLKTVKTTFTGNYSHTFDIPEQEEVFFEVSVIDQCSGNAIIVGFEKEGNKEVVDFIVCEQDFTGEDENEDDDKEEEEEEGDDDDDDDDDENTGLPSFINCEALGLDIPVCTEDTDGNTVEYASACAALEAGIKLQELNFCDGLPDGIGNGLGNGFNCDQLGFDLPINVCVTDTDGNKLTLPLCTALDENYPLSQIEFCEGGDLSDLAGLIGLDSLDCEELGLNLPVCATDADGNALNFDTPCAALDAGLGINELSLCDGILGNGEIGDILDIDCEELAENLPFTVCIINDFGESEEVQVCDALAGGLSFDELVLCDGGTGILETIDCEELGIDLPVCLVDADGNELNFDTPCAALEAGIGLNEITFCDGFVDGILEDIDCESLGMEVDIPVCTVNEAGESVELMLCEALTQGIALDQIELCEGALDDIDCAGLGIDIPVCATDSDGNELNFDNPCDALAAGLGINEITFCEGLVDGILNDFDCDNLGIELPISVCVLNNAGEEEELDLCAALSQGISPENISVCSNTFDGLDIDSDDCAGLGLNIPVCVLDDDGNTLKYDNPCAAIDAGWKISDLDFCDNLLEDVMAAAFTSTPTEEEEVVIEKADLFPNPANKTLTLNLKLAESAEFMVTIQAINGNAIYRQKYHMNNGENMTHIDVSSLSVGIYVVKVATANSIKAMKFIKQ